MGCKMRVACCVLGLVVSTTGIPLNGTHYPVEVNDEIIHCKMCRPGTFWIKHCSQDGDNSQCQNCPDGRFETDNNRARYCRKCTECTENDQPLGVIVAEACTRYHDTKCGCKPGFWKEESVGDCQEVSPCMPGHGVEKMANSHNDTTCKRCVNGKTFSNISSELMPCLNCSLCPEGWVQGTPCNETQNTVCISKDEEENNSIIIILLGVPCGVLLAVAIVSYCFRKRIHLILQSWRYSLSQENHVDEEQANPLQRDGRRQENHDDKEQANPLQQDRRLQENHDDKEQANPLQQDRRRQENHDDVEQAHPLQQGGTPDKSAVNISRHQWGIPLGLPYKFWVNQHSVNA